MSLHFSRLVLAFCFGLLGVLLLCGLAGVVLLSFGYFPTLEPLKSSHKAVHTLLHNPQIAGAVMLSISTALIATLCSVVFSFGLMAAFSHQAYFRVIRRCISPILAIPHGLLALAMIVLFAPTGWLMRLISDVDEVPPDYFFAPDPYGIGLVAVLVLKETAFLTLLLLAHHLGAQSERLLNTARSLGYGPLASWLKVIFPLLYVKMRFPILAVLVFSFSVLEIPLMTNSYDSPTLAILIYRYYQHPDLAMMFPAAAGSLMLLILSAILVSGWLLIERSLVYFLRPWLIGGQRYFAENILPKILMFILLLMGIVVVFGLIGQILYALSFRWAFPDPLPETWITGHEAIAMISDRDIFSVMLNTLFIGGASAIISVTLGVFVLVLVRKYLFSLLITGAFLPLFIPQISLMIGIQWFLLSWELAGSYGVVILIHIFFIMPYVLLSLLGGVRHIDWRYLDIAQSMGLGWYQRLYRVILPICLRPILVSLAVGFAVSSAQYLPTVWAGQGKIESLMTLFLQVNSGGNLREIAQIGLVLLVLVAIPFVIAGVVPRWLYRQRRGMLWGHE